MDDLAGKDMQVAKELQEDLASSSDHESQHAAAMQGWMACLCGCGIWCARQDRSHPWPYDISIFCLKLTLLSWWHLWVLLSLPAGVALGVIAHTQQEHILGGALNVATCMIAMVLTLAAPLDECRRLDIELETFKEKTKLMESVRHKVRIWAGKYERVTKLWQLQTMNKLDLFDALSGLNYSTGALLPGSEEERQRISYTMELNRRTQKVVESMGEPKLYLDQQNGLDDEVLTVAAQEIKAQIERIGALVDKKDYGQVLHHLGNFFGIIRVRIKRATRLPHLQQGMASAYIVLRVGDTKTSECPRTLSIGDSQDPSWNQDFYLWAPEKASFTLEVWSSDEGAWTGETTRLIAYRKVAFSEDPGHWIECVDDLMSSPYNKVMRSKIEYAFGYAQSMNHMPALQRGEEEDDFAPTLSGFLRA